MSKNGSIVFVVDDDPAMRMSLESLLQSVGHTVAAFETARDFRMAPRPDLPSCLVLDVRLPGQSGLEFQREIGRTASPPPIVFITGHGDVPMSVAAMKAGAVEFLTKPFRDQDLIDGVHRAIELDRRRRAKAAMLAELRERVSTMTPREREILPLVAAGRMNKQIAQALQLSEVTVKVHRAQVMQKLKANSVADLVRIADRLAAIEPEAKMDGTSI
ncbi:MAG TPA: response regulator [Bosea sp. (in: a-proteobacteria)]|jgi:FixJ family two-component response regulator|uniref:response regulator transcription factor n=1 Tax=Bosea sp. (in: a-proteobacteria) TaxID=1871050 RepID=UPI002DDCD75C|nr:response regulator [Bosea sp. (in: a-proteobacteria)]HEV2553344.1 response regulator [Bosea sp. (in: a-proteobacteria)]